MTRTYGVVIPTWNRAAWVVEAVQSVRAQTRPAAEIVVVDDGSTDDTARRLGGLENVRLVRQEHLGPAAARNRGVLETHSDWIVFLDSDDRWAPGTLEAIERTVARRPDAGLVSIMAREAAADGRPTGAIRGKRSPGEDYTTAGLLRHDAGGCSWFAVRRDAFERAGAFDESLRSAEECDLVLRLSFDTRLVAVREPLLLRRRHAGMLSADQLLNARCWIRILEKLRDGRPEWVARHARVFDRSWAKEHLRMGRELLRRGGDRSALQQARKALRVARRTRPLHLRTWLYSIRLRFSAAFSASSRSSSTSP